MDFKQSDGEVLHQMQAEGRERGEQISEVDGLRPEGTSEAQR